VFRAQDARSLSDLERAVQAGAPTLTIAEREVAVRGAEARQARLLDNPSLDAAWSTLPVGRTNPSDLSRPYANVPSYGVGISYTFPIGKRGPRRGRADALLQGARAELEFVARELAIDLAEVLGGLATATLRYEGISDLVAGGRRAAELAEARLRAQFGTPLDVDQMQIEVERTEQLLSAVESEISLRLAACARLVGTPCEGFQDAAAARAYLARWFMPRGLEARDLGARADLRALGAYGKAAGAEMELARAARLPDPTLRLGYLHDRFVVSGSQLNSLNVSISVPLPLFDHGQHRSAAAEASRHHLLDEQSRRMATAKARIPVLNTRLELSRSRCTRLDRELIPRARQVLASLEKAVENRLLPLTQVIQSRRIVSELFIEEAESCGDAFVAALELAREIPSAGDMP
jgi:cobalt-zinc-cadmium efflux system outer membrane protein